MTPAMPARSRSFHTTGGGAVSNAAALSLAGAADRRELAKRVVGLAEGKGARTRQTFAKVRELG